MFKEIPTLKGFGLHKMYKTFNIANSTKRFRAKTLVNKAFVGKSQNSIYVGS